MDTGEKITSTADVSITLFCASFFFCTTTFIRKTFLSLIKKEVVTEIKIKTRLLFGDQTHLKADAGIQHMVISTSKPNNACREVEQQVLQILIQLMFPFLTYFTTIWTNVSLKANEQRRKYKKLKHRRTEYFAAGARFKLKFKTRGLTENTVVTPT